MTEMTLSKPVFLSGMMGSGKSTVGRLLAKKMDVPFHDLDDLIEKQEQMPIPEIFNKKGEEHFRKVERDLLENRAKKLRGVIALGGGSLQNQEVVDHLKNVGITVFLQVPISVLLKRLRGGRNRPMLSDVDLEEKFRTLMNERLPLYEQANITISIENEPHIRVVQSIIDKLTTYEH